MSTNNIIFEFSFRIKIIWCQCGSNGSSTPSNGTTHFSAHTEEKIQRIEMIALQIDDVFYFSFSSGSGNKSIHLPIMSSKLFRIHCIDAVSKQHLYAVYVSRSCGWKCTIALTQHLKSTDDDIIGHALQWLLVFRNANVTVVVFSEYVCYVRSFTFKVVRCSIVTKHNLLLKHTRFHLLYIARRLFFFRLCATSELCFVVSCDSRHAIHWHTQRIRKLHTLV